MNSYRFNQLQQLPDLKKPPDVRGFCVDYGPLFGIAIKTDNSLVDNQFKRDGKIYKFNSKPTI